MKLDNDAAVCIPEGDLDEHLLWPKNDYEIAQESQIITMKTSRLRVYKTNM